MNVGAFFKSIRPTIFFAFAGTILSTFVVAAFVFGAGALGLCYPLSPLASLTFGSLISATDPVAVLSTFQVPPAPEASVPSPRPKQCPPPDGLHMGARLALRPCRRSA